jgi:hypothetical protein
LRVNKASSILKTNNQGHKEKPSIRREGNRSGNIHPPVGLAILGIGFIEQVIDRHAEIQLVLAGEQRLDGVTVFYIDHGIVIQLERIGVIDVCFGHIADGT